MPARTLAGFAAAVAAIVVAVAAYFLVATDRNRRAAEVARRSESVVALQRLDDALARADAEQRGYLLTHEERSLSAYRRAVADVHAELDRVQARLDAGRRSGSGDALPALVDAKLSELRHVLDVRDADGFAPALRELHAGNAGWLTDAIEEIRGELEETERAALADRRRAWFGLTALADGIFLGANLVLLVLVTIAGLAARAEMRRREERARERLRMIELQERILGIVSHDLRTPLAAIQGGATLLSRAGLAPGPARVAALVDSSAHRMEGIIRDLLDFTRTRSTLGIPLSIRPSDAGELCARVVDEATLGGGPQRIELRRDGELAGEWDPDRLVQAIGNLVSNALRHALPGTPVRIRAAADGDHVRIEVENDGAAIAPEAVPSLFDPYRRAAGSDGLGLGLFIVRTIAEAHGGTVEVAPAPPPAVRFVVRLPRLPPERRRDAGPERYWQPTRPDDRSRAQQARAR